MRSTIRWSVMVETIFIPASLEVRIGFATINGVRTLSASLLSPPWKAGTVLRGSPAVGTASIVLCLPQLFQGLDPPAIVGIQLYRTLIVLDSQLFVAVDQVSLAEAVIGVR